MSDSKTKEKQYQFMVDMLEQKGPVTMTCRPSVMWRQDPKLLGFTLARHKFVAKMLTGYSRVLEDWLFSNVSLFIRPSSWK